MYGIFIAITLALFVRIGFVLFSGDNQKRSEKISATIISKEKTNALRGTIYDRNYRPLITSDKQYTIRLDVGAEGCMDSVRFSTKARELSKKLSEFFGDATPQAYFKKIMSKYAQRYTSRYVKKDTIFHKPGIFEKAYRRITKRKPVFDPDRDSIAVKHLGVPNKNHPMVVLCKNIDYTQLCTLKTFPILDSSLGHVYQVEDNDVRIRPQHDLAKSILGICEGENRAGMEFYYKDTLRSTPGCKYFKNLAPKLFIPYSDKEHPFVMAQNGYDIVTTLDADVQDVMTLALKDALKDPGSFRAMSIVMECSTGDIIAMSNLDKDKKGRISEHTNHIIRHRYEPGSTFKLATTIALLDGKKMNPQRCYDSAHGKRVSVGRREVQDAGDDGGVINLRQALVKSANVYFAKAVFDHYANDEKGYVEQLKKLHLNETLSLGEIKGSAPLFKTTTDKEWYKQITIVSLSYGYEIEITPLHLTMLYNAMANNGRMMAPRLIQRVESEDSVISNNPPRVMEECICSKSTRDFFTSALKEAALEGTGKFYFGENVTPYRVAAKTGTAQYSQHRMKNTYVGSMVLFFPAENPKYTIYTAVIKTKQFYNDTYYGASLAGPINQKIASYLYTRDIRTNMFSAQGDTEIKIKGGHPSHLSRVMNNFGLSNPITDMQKFCRFDCESLQSDDMEIEPSIMPDLSGLGMKDALFLAERQGLKVVCKGTGSVTKQSIGAGDKIKPGQKLFLQFSPKAELDKKGKTYEKESQAKSENK